ncbi:Probable cytochrome P450 9f2 [Eumeta japonica]|uniref:unspecific monooxygenase n=1 Tax=Eumeta variegata TaxID=151549 RepID=A0A4C1WG75_EUMVA|nr:Probable cytochrome P450 9f2 [Eumeta japonica]
MIAEILVLLLTILVVYLFYAHRKNINEFRKNGVNVLPGVPLFGNAWRSVFQRRHIFYDFDEVYRAFPDDRYVGYIDGISPVLLIRDPEVIKQITTKDFDHFINHTWILNEDANPLLAGSLLLMKDEKWRDMRITLSPAFTGSKMKKMVPFMNTVARNIVEYLRTNIDGDVSGEVDVLDLISCYTNDVIASSAFGLEVNSVADKNNKFYTTGQRLSNLTFPEKITLLMITVLPSLTAKLDMKLFPEEITNFFRDILKSTIEYREKNNVERPDMIQLLMEAAKGTLISSKEDNDIDFANAEGVELKPEKPIRKWTINDLTAQAFIFFAAGFDTAGSAIVLAIHELAINPDIQQKLYEEIKQVSHDKRTLTYEVIQEMKYLDMVMNETLRKWASALVLNCLCNKTYYLPPVREGAKPYKVEKGTKVYNIVNSIHMDEKYYPDPERFKPERFSEENKKHIKPFTFMPFGMGPRHCIGARFAMLELKVFLYHLLLNFEILKYDKTTDPLRLTKSNFNMRAQGGTWVKLSKR